MRLIVAAHRIVDDRRLALNVLASRLAQQPSQHRGDAEPPSIRRKTVATAPECLAGQTGQFLQSRTGGDAQLALCQPQDAAWTQHAHAFTQQGQPCLPGQHAYQQAAVHQVKGLIVQLERLRDIHHPEVGIVQSLGARTHAREIDHTPTYIHTGDLQTGMIVGHFECSPTRRSASSAPTCVLNCAWYTPTRVMRATMKRCEATPTARPVAACFAASNSRSIWRKSRATSLFPSCLLMCSLLAFLCSGDACFVPLHTGPRDTDREDLLRCFRITLTISVAEHVQKKWYKVASSSKKWIYFIHVVRCLLAWSRRVGCYEPC